MAGGFCFGHYRQLRYTQSLILPATMNGNSNTIPTIARARRHHGDRRVGLGLLVIGGQLHFFSRLI